MRNPFRVLEIRLRHKFNIWGVIVCDCGHRTPFEGDRSAQLNRDYAHWQKSHEADERKVMDEFWAQVRTDISKALDRALDKEAFHRAE